MGGGGFSMEPDNPLLDQYVLQTAHKANPTVCFLPTASGDSDNYIARFYTAFSKLPCRPRHLSLFCQPADLGAFVAECDVIYVGGGNTRNMLAIWRACQLDTILHRAWENGVVLCGVSAGAICWFEHGHTDSGGPQAPLAPLVCLGFLPGSCTPHYDGELKRRSSFHSLIQQGVLPAGYALDDGTALHFIGDDLAHIVTSRPHARAFRVRCESSNVVEEQLQTRFLKTTNDA
jgi:dipeptidase E